MNMIRSLRNHIHFNLLELQKTKTQSYLEVEMRLQLIGHKDFIMSGKTENKRSNLKEMNFLKRNKSYVS